MASTKRQYRSEIREKQLHATRDAIIDAAISLLSESRVPSVSVPEVASAAGVGVATVYRHFGSRDDLFDAVYDRWMRSARELLVDEPQRDLHRFLEILPELWRRQSENEPLAEAMSAYSPAGKQVRRRRRERRRAVADTLLASQPLRSTDRRRLAPLVLLLTSTTAYKHMRDHWDLDVDQASELVAWAVASLVHAADSAGSYPS